MVTAIRAERAEKEWWIVSGINLLCLHQPFWRPGLGFPGRSNSNTTDSDWGGSNSFQPLWLKSPFRFTFFILLPYHDKPTDQLCGLYLFWFIEWELHVRGSWLCLQVCLLLTTHTNVERLELICQISQYFFKHYYIWTQNKQNLQPCYLCLILSGNWQATG